MGRRWKALDADSRQHYKDEYTRLRGDQQARKEVGRSVWNHCFRIWTGSGFRWFLDPDPDPDWEPRATKKLKKFFGGLRFLCKVRKSFMEAYTFVSEIFTIFSHQKSRSGYGFGITKCLDTNPNSDKECGSATQVQGIQNHLDGFIPVFV